MAFASAQPNVLVLLRYNSCSSYNYLPASSTRLEADSSQLSASELRPSQRRETRRKHLFVRLIFEEIRFGRSAMGASSPPSPVMCSKPRQIWHGTFGISSMEDPFLQGDPVFSIARQAAERKLQRGGDLEVFVVSLHTYEPYLFGRHSTAYDQSAGRLEEPISLTDSLGRNNPFASLTESFFAKAQPCNP